LSLRTRWSRFALGRIIPSERELFAPKTRWFRWFRRIRLFRTLQGRLTALFVLAATVLVAAGSLLLLTDQSRNADALLTKTLRTRIDRIVSEAEATGALPNTEVYAQVITAFGSVRDLTPTLAKELLLTDDQVRYVFRQGQLQIDGRLPQLSGDGRLLAQARRMKGTPVVVVVGISRELERLTRRRLLLTLAIAGPSLVALLGLGGWMLAGAALRPVRRMSDEAADISRADTGRRLALPQGSEEIVHLGRTLNAMLDRLATSFAREKSFVDDASHELRTPLAILRGELELATIHTQGPEDTLRTLHSAIDEVDRLSALADQLLVLARAGSTDETSSLREGEFSPVSSALDEIVPAVVDRVRSTLHKDVAVYLNVSATGRVAMRDEQLSQILTNLLTNASRYARREVAVTVTEVASVPGAIDLVVADDGPGFDEKILPTAFERFTIADRARTRRAATGGAGLGLAIVRTLSESAGGSVTASNGDPLGGARVTVSLPTLTGNT
jgi:two-component system, OmpR family, sensor kinase